MLSRKQFYTYQTNIQELKLNSKPSLKPQQITKMFGISLKDYYLLIDLETYHQYKQFYPHSNTILWTLSFLFSNILLVICIFEFNLVLHSMTGPLQYLALAFTIVGIANAILTLLTSFRALRYEEIQS